MSKLEDALISDFVNKGTPIPEWVKALCHKAGAKINFEELQPSFPEEEEPEEEKPQGEEPQGGKKNGEDSGSELEEEIKTLMEENEALQDAATQKAEEEETEAKLAAEIAEEEEAATNAREEARIEAITKNNEAVDVLEDALKKLQKKPEDNNCKKAAKAAEEKANKANTSLLELLKEQAERE